MLPSLYYPKTARKSKIRQIAGNESPFRQPTTLKRSRSGENLRCCHSDLGCFRYFSDVAICWCSMLSFCWKKTSLFPGETAMFWLMKTPFFTLSHHSCRWDRATNPPWICWWNHHESTIFLRWNHHFSAPSMSCYVLLAGHSPCAGGDALPGAWAFF